MCVDSGPIGIKKLILFFNDARYNFLGLVGWFQQQIIRK